MTDSEGVVTRLVARVKALLPEDWLGRAGERFRGTTQSISDFSKEYGLFAKQVAKEGIKWVARKVDQKLEGLVNKEYADAVKDFAEAEQTEIETELKRRTLQANVRESEAKADLVEAQVRREKLEAGLAELNLVKKLQDAGVIPRLDGRGNLLISPIPKHRDLSELAERFAEEPPPRSSSEVPAQKALSPSAEPAPNEITPPKRKTKKRLTKDKASRKARPKKHK